MKSSSTWLFPPLNISLADDEIHVWRSFLDLPKTLIKKHENILSEDELIRANRFHFSKDRDRFVVARGTLRKILSHYLGIKPEQVQFQYSQHGKPFLRKALEENKLTSQTSDLEFNISHSNVIALFGVTKFRPIGVDVEYTKYLPDADKIAARFFSPQENSAYQGLAKEHKQNAFYHCWTRKEAFIKAVGEGLSYPLDQFVVNFLPNEQPRIKQIHGDPSQGEKWSLDAIVPSLGYIGAVAVEGQGLNYVYYDFKAANHFHK